MDAKKHLLDLGFDDAHLPNFFNDDDKSYYTIPELMESYAEAVKEDKEALSEHNTNVVSQFMEHCKQENIEIPDRMFETFFDA